MGCHDGDEMSCYGGKDWNGCLHPDFCAPTKGAPGFDGNECPAFCPTKCDGDDMSCNGGKDWNGCQYPDFCAPTKQPPGFDGNDCPGFCPTKCDGDDFIVLVDKMLMAVKCQQLVC